jgi:hypothetical protein
VGAGAGGLPVLSGPRGGYGAARQPAVVAVEMAAERRAQGWACGRGENRRRAGGERQRQVSAGGAVEMTVRIRRHHR